jgi:hypothetical protein
MDKVILVVKTGNSEKVRWSPHNSFKPDCQSFTVLRRNNNKKTEGGLVPPKTAFAVSTGNRFCHDRKKLIDEIMAHLSGCQGGINQYSDGLDTGRLALSIHTVKTGGNDLRTENPFAPAVEPQINHTPANAPSNG